MGNSLGEYELNHECISTSDLITPERVLIIYECDQTWLQTFQMRLRLLCTTTTPSLVELRTFSQISSSVYGRRRNTGILVYPIIGDLRKQSGLKK